MKEKILLLCGTSQTVYTFRLGLIRTLKEKGYDVYVSALDDEYKEKLKEEGIELITVHSKNRSLNPFQICSQKRKYRKLIREIQPSIVFTFMLKPNLLGAKAAQEEKVEKIFSMVEGAGDVFINETWKWKLIRAIVCRMYQRAFAGVRKVFFLNEDDQAEFLTKKLLKQEQCEIVRGVGVDLKKFSFEPIKNDKTFLMVARMLKTKGVFEYCECARTVKKKYPDAQFLYLGAESTVTLDDIAEYLDDGSVQYLGTTEDVRAYLAACTAYVLPSYREGMPVSVMEAQAVGRAVITCDSVGCKETVIDGYNGFLVKVKDVGSMAEKCIKILEDPQKAVKMGKNARTFAEEYFDSEKINRQLLAVLED
ncbi:MAG: glycosyltransferase family 4 protein [Clostridia bacterium]|nr:glycosyltransferase family 4 protein [Clostridia bacterium]